MRLSTNEQMSGGQKLEATVNLQSEVISPSYTGSQFSLSTRDDPATAFASISMIRAVVIKK